MFASKCATFSRQKCLTLVIDFHWGSFEARKQLNNRHKSDLIHYQTGNGLRHASGPVLSNSHVTYFHLCSMSTNLTSRVKVITLPDCHVDIIFMNKFSEMHFSVSFGNPNHRLNVTHRDGNTSSRHRLATQVAVHFCNLQTKA